MSTAIRLAPRRTRTGLLAVGSVGVAVAAGLRFVEGAGADPIARILTLGFLGIVPLALAVIPSTGPGWDRLLKVAALLHPLCALAATVSLWMPVGPAGLWASPWMGFSLLVAWMGASRLRAPGALRSAPALTAAAALLYLPVGAGWLVMARAGIRPMGFDAMIVTLTAVHFHFAALAAPIFSARTSEAAPPGRARSVAGAAGLALVVAIPIVALGLTVSPWLALLGAVLLAAALLTVAALVARGPARASERTAAKLLFGIAAISLLLSMPLAVYYQWGQASGTGGVGLEWMVRIHGFANAHGFATCGLLAWAIEDRNVD